MVSNYNNKVKWNNKLLLYRLYFVARTLLYVT
jgi:hypothetical protein